MPYKDSEAGRGGGLDNVPLPFLIRNKVSSLFFFFFLLPLLVCFCVRLLFCYAVLCALFSFAIMPGTPGRAGWFAFTVLCLCLKVMWVGLQCVFVAYPDHTHYFRSVKEAVQDCYKVIPQLQNSHRSFVR